MEEDLGGLLALQVSYSEEIEEPVHKCLFEAECGNHPIVILNEPKPNNTCMTAAHAQGVLHRKFSSYSLPLHVSDANLAKQMRPTAAHFQVTLWYNHVLKGCLWPHAVN